ncbi:MAG: hypothetical protein IK082_05470 [Oscillospiraceae bacterium]|nr:hypothetical protein [Oscillospiraceae bacterium]
MKDWERGQIEIDGFQLNYEKFLTACDAQELEGKWDVESNGEMDAWFANDLICAVVRLIAADGKVSMEEVKYLNKSLGFSYTADELQEVYRLCGDRIEYMFEREIPRSIEQLRQLEPGLAELYRTMMLQICDLIIISDGKIADEERKTAEQLRGMI